MKIAGHETHPAADALPMIEGGPFGELCADIAAHGLLEPVVLHGGKILDGRNRALACERTGKPLVTVEWAGQCGSPVQFVITKNLRRRDLSESQRAMVGAAMMPLFAAEAEERRLSNLRKPANPSMPPTGGVEDDEESDESEGRSAAKAAAAVDVSPRSVERAVAVLREGVPELVAAVKAGDIAVSKAERMAKGNPAEQRAALVEAREKPARAKPPRDVFVVSISMPMSEAARIVRQLEHLGFETTRQGESIKEMRLDPRRAA